MSVTAIKWSDHSGHSYELKTGYIHEMHSEMTFDLRSDLSKIVCSNITLSAALQLINVLKGFVGPTEEEVESVLTDVKEWTA